MYIKEIEGNYTFDKNKDSIHQKPSLAQHLLEIGFHTFLIEFCISGQSNGDRWHKKLLASFSFPIREAIKNGKVILSASSTN